MSYLIIACICFILGLLCFFIGKALEFDNLISTSISISFFLFFISSIGNYGYHNAKENKNCLEQNLSIIPKIIHMEDSSKKILKYKYKNEEYEMEIDRSENEFYLPESLLKIEPCDRRIFVKKS